MLSTHRHSSEPDYSHPNQPAQPPHSPTPGSVPHLIQPAPSSSHSPALTIAPVDSTPHTTETAQAEGLKLSYSWTPVPEVPEVPEVPRSTDTFPTTYSREYLVPQHPESPGALDRG